MSWQHLQDTTKMGRLDRHLSGWQHPAVNRSFVEFTAFCRRPVACQTDSVTQASCRWPRFDIFLYPSNKRLTTFANFTLSAWQTSGYLKAEENNKGGEATGRLSYAVSLAAWQFHSFVNGVMSFWLTDWLTDSWSSNSPLIQSIYINDPFGLLQADFFFNKQIIFFSYNKKHSLKKPDYCKLSVTNSSLLLSPPAGNADLGGGLVLSLPEMQNHESSANNTSQSIPLKNAGSSNCVCP